VKGVEGERRPLSLVGQGRIRDKKQPTREVTIGNGWKSVNGLNASSKQKESTVTKGEVNAGRNRDLNSLGKASRLAETKY